MNLSKILLDHNFYPFLFVGDLHDAESIHGWVARLELVFLKSDQMIEHSGTNV